MRQFMLSMANSKEKGMQHAPSEEMQARAL